MIPKPFMLTLGFILFLAVFTGCQGSKEKTSAEKATSIPSPESEKATVTGKVFSTTLNQPYPKAPVFLAEVYRNGEDGAYVLNTTFSPSNFADEQGVFVIPNIDPKEYVIVIGNPEDKSEIIPDDSGRARVWKTEPGKILDVGQLNVSLSPSTP